MRKGLLWWLDNNNLTVGVSLHITSPDFLLFSDALAKGWVAHLEDLLILGEWSQLDKQLHINVLELKAAFLVLQEFQERVMGHSVVLMTDNTTVVVYVNKRGRLVS